MRKIILLVLLIFVIGGWGATGHKIINRKIVLSFPPQMNMFLWMQDSLARHGSDADYRKSSDPTESPRHFIDIDTYPEFVSQHRIPQTLDSLINLHGYQFVYDNGILPFAIIATTDSVRKYFQLHDFQKAMLKAADLGHYVADAHNPLHITENYDGQLTGQTGVHSRYETQMINRDSAYFTYGGDTSLYVNNINEFAFNMIYNNYQYVDSVLYSDSVARAMAGNYGTNYYTFLWNLSGNFTIQLFRNASNYISRLIYTAWVNAGSPTPVIANEEKIQGYKLSQNYPNPFNPKTQIEFSIGKNEFVSLKVYNIKGSEVESLVQGELKSGNHKYTFDASGINSGIYFYVIQAGEFRETKKMLVIK